MIGDGLGIFVADLGIIIWLYFLVLFLRIPAVGWHGCIGPVGSAMDYGSGIRN